MAKPWHQLATVIFFCDLIWQKSVDLFLNALMVDKLCLNKYWQKALLTKPINAHRPLNWLWELDKSTTNMTRFLIAITSLLVLGASVQVSLKWKKLNCSKKKFQGFKTDQSENSLPATPSHALKKLMYILSEPKFNQKNNVQTKEIDKIIEYVSTDPKFKKVIFFFNF